MVLIRVLSGKNEWTNESTKDGKMEGWKGGKMERRMDGRMEGWKDGEDGRMDGPMMVMVKPFFLHTQFSSP